MPKADFLKRRWMAFAAAALSLLACYGTLAMVALLGALGITIAANDAVWAGAIFIFAWLALLALWLRGRRHHVLRPVAVAAVGVALITFTMVFAYARLAEIVGFAFLCAGTYLDWRVGGRGRRTV